MVAVIEDICQYVQKKIADHGDLDKYTILQEVARRLQEDADVHLRLEYMLIEEDDE